MMFCAQPGWISRKSPSSTTRADDVVHVVRTVDGSSGTIASSVAIHPIARIRRVHDAARSPRLFCGRMREDRAAPPRAPPPRRAAARCATPLRVVCVVAPPSRSAVDLLVGHRLHDVRPGDEHVARPLDHDHEVGDRRRVDRAAGARPHDDGDLRDHAGGAACCAGRCRRSRRATTTPSWIRAPPESFRPMIGAPTFIARSMTLTDLLGVRLRQRSAEDGEVLAEDEDEPAVDASVAGDDAVAEDTRCSSSPKSLARCVTNASSSTNDARRRAGGPVARAPSACRGRAAARSASRPHRGAPPRASARRRATRSSFVGTTHRSFARRRGCLCARTSRDIRS